MAKKKIDTRDLVKRIEDLTKSKMSKTKVVDLGMIRDLTKEEEPHCVLVIEDDETMRGAMKRILETEGYAVKTAADGTQLTKVLDDSPIDMIILDVGLPWINGFELAQLLKEHEDLKRIPLIFVSGKTSEEDVKRGFEVGADDYIKKPFDIDKIKKTVRTLLNLSQGGPGPDGDSTA